METLHGITRIQLLGVLALSLSCTLATLPAKAEEGEQWEYTMSAEMEGMKLPLPPTTVCVRPDDGLTPPVEPHCQLKDHKVSGNSTAFTIVCGPPEPGEMRGEFTRTGDRVEGRYTRESADGTMTVTTGGRLLGACDPSKPPLPGGK